MEKNRKILLLFSSIALFIIILISGSGSSSDYTCKYSAVGQAYGELGAHCGNANDPECVSGTECLYNTCVANLGTSCDSRSDCSGACDSSFIGCESNECIGRNVYPCGNQGTGALQEKCASNFECRENSQGWYWCTKIAPENQEPIGYLDAVNCDWVGGWAKDPDTTSPISVHFYLDYPAGQGEALAADLADKYREDLCGYDDIGCDHAFHYVFPENIKNQIYDGKNHTFYAYAIDSEGGNNPQIGETKTFGPCQLEEPVCGDGNLDSGEECDDGNLVNGDGCSSVCEIEEPEPVCDNGIVEAGEECDDGNNVNGDWCSSTCEIESPIIYNPEIIPEYPTCSNNLEICANVFTKGTLSYVKLSCNAGTTKVNKTMVLKFGDKYCTTISNITLGAQDGLEVSCQIFALDNYGSDEEEISTVYECPGSICGDGNLDLPSEECDDGNTVNGDGCSSTCLIESPSPVCDNGIIETGEECDAGGNNGVVCDNSTGDCNYCSNVCELEYLECPGGGDDETSVECDDWKRCNNGVQKRVCYEIKGSEVYSEFKQKRDCVPDFVPLNQETTTGTNKTTLEISPNILNNPGTGNGSTGAGFLIFLIILILLIIIGIIFVVVARK